MDLPQTLSLPSSSLLTALLWLPLATAFLAFVARNTGAAARGFATLAHGVGITALLVLAFIAAGEIMSAGPLSALHHWAYVDTLGAIFVVLVALIAFITGVHSIGYMGHELKHGHIDAKQLCDYFAIFNLFVFTMLLAATANNIIMMWVAVEATTLGSAFLVGFYRKRSALEAVWKYVIICTVGVAFGLYGVVLVYSSGANALPNPGDAAFWTSLLQHAQLLDPTLTRLAYVFVLIGFGTKAGLFPMHAWLPDAHSEAPSPISALLSAVLLNCAMLVVLRFTMLTSKSLGPDFAQTLLIVFGVLSIAVAAFFIVVQRDIKRLLAYSSVENMGLIALAFGIGGPLGVAAGLLHTINHSLAKTLLFCGSGNVLLKFGTPHMDKVKGLLRLTPLTGAMLGAGALALGGVPPFNVFVSEFMIVTAGIKLGHLALIVFVLLLLTVVLAGLVRMLAGTLFGPAPEDVAKGESGVLTWLPMVVLLALMLMMGLRAPEPVMALVQSATHVVVEGSAAQAPSQVASENMSVRSSQ